MRLEKITIFLFAKSMSSVKDQWIDLISSPLRVFMFCKDLYLWQIVLSSKQNKSLITKLLPDIAIFQSLWSKLTEKFFNAILYFPKNWLYPEKFLLKSVDVRKMLTFIGYSTSTRVITLVRFILQLNITAP